MVYNTQNCWVFGFRPTSGILENKKRTERFANWICFCPHVRGGRQKGLTTITGPLVICCLTASPNGFVSPVSKNLNKYFISLSLTVPPSCFLTQSHSHRQHSFVRSLVPTVHPPDPKFHPAVCSNKYRNQSGEIKRTSAITKFRDIARNCRALTCCMMVSYTYRRPRINVNSVVQ
jgi:hypothetical protein